MNLGGSDFPIECRLKAWVPAFGSAKLKFRVDDESWKSVRQAY